MGEGKGGKSQLWGRGREERVSCGGGEGRLESAVGEGKGGKSQLWGRGRKRSAVTSLICG